MEGLKDLLKRVQNGDLEIKEALNELKTLPYKDIGHTKIDTHRKIRRGFPEAIFCENKTKKQILEILKQFPEETIIATRASQDIFDYVKKELNDVKYHKKANIIQVGEKLNKKGGKVSVVSGGTSDEEVAEECAVSAEIMGNEVKRMYDIGISGLHRLFSKLEDLRNSRVIVVVAGMEGALPGLVASLVSVPVVGVPTSVGYGTHLEGIAPLLTMLNSCVPGLSVMNIDNGYGAAYLASTINDLSSDKNE
ncbi:nickel pincer cofactor biosynthesis protein LarB [archaeon SCG-AAA382B04]|nr:nickel pincer cofactor biosynthesis protein LarB [archaeon SCG-AAA382B04]